MAEVDMREVTEEREKEKFRIDRSQVVSQKKTLGQKVLDTFVQEDILDVRSYVINDLLVPFLKDSALDILAMILGRDIPGGYRKDRDKGYRDYTASYKGYSYRSEREKKERRSERRDRDEDFDPRRVLLKDRVSAEKIIDKMEDYIYKEGKVTIADLAEMVQEPSNYQDNNWGWTSMRGIEVQRVRGGLYLIRVPEPKYVDDID